MERKRIKRVGKIIFGILFLVFSILLFGRTTSRFDYLAMEKPEPVIKVVEMTATSTENISTAMPIAVKQEVVESLPINSEHDVLLDVPFSPQAPFGEWSDPRQQDGCEEIATVMAVYWARRLPLSREQAKKEIFALADYELEKYLSYEDTSAADTVTRLFKGYYKYDQIEVKYDVDAQKIKEELYHGNLVIVPLNGRAIGNPYYTRGGPERHMLLIIGYDSKTKEFITNDAGTRHGQGYRYRVDRVISSIRDYPTGDHLPITQERKAMIVVKSQ
jgi:hypothetical protein